MSELAMRFGEFTVQFNPLTGELTVTSATETIVVVPVSPGKIRLAPKRRENLGVKV